MALTASKLTAINMKKNLIDLTYMYQGGLTEMQGRSKKFEGKVNTEKLRANCFSMPGTRNTRSYFLFKGF